MVKIAQIHYNMMKTNTNMIKLAQNTLKYDEKSTNSV